MKTQKNVIPHSHKITKENRQLLSKHKSLILWCVGLSGSGKSTLAGKVEEKLFEMGYHTYILDGDNIRMGLNKNLSFSEEDRKENIRRIGETAKLFVDAGIIVLTAFISPFREDRKRIRELVQPGEFIEIYVNCPIEVCETRDVKGLYKKARDGEIKDFTGINSPFEPSITPEIEINTDKMNLDESVQKILNYLVPRLSMDN